MTDISLHEPPPPPPGRPWRKIVQYLFLATVVAIGVQFAAFVHPLLNGLVPTIPRPPGVEAFLPISALVSLKYWLVTGVFNRIHPSGLVIFLLTLITAVLFKRGFCSWVCPFGLIAEHLTWIHQRIFGKRLAVHKWVDRPLRSLKYLLLGFFLWSVVGMMDARVLHQFIYSPYNRVADIKMFLFFSDISPLALGILVALIALSVVIPYFWCRYLCPYGALLGGLSVISLLKIRRNPDKCIDCHRCSHACPAAIAVHASTCVRHDECHGCLNCVRVCPSPGALAFTPPGRQRPMPTWVIALALLALFGGGSLIARSTGYWQNVISPAEYRFHSRRLNLTQNQPPPGMTTPHARRRSMGPRLRPNDDTRRPPGHPPVKSSGGVSR